MHGWDSSADFWSVTNISSPPPAPSSISHGSDHRLRLPFSSDRLVAMPLQAPADFFEVQSFFAQPFFKFLRDDALCY